MEAVAALGVACNVLQLVEFGLQLTSKCHEIYASASGLTEQTAAIDDIATESSTTFDTLQQALESKSSALNQEDNELKVLGAKANAAATRLRDIIGKLKQKNNGKSSKRAVITGAFKQHWYEDEIKEITLELQEYRSILDTRLLVDLR